MRYIKLIIGIGCLALVPLPTLLFLGYLTFFFIWPFALCALGLIGIGSFLIAKRKTPLSGKARILTVLTVFILVGFVAIIVVPDFVAGTRFRQANACVSNLRQIDAAKNQWALENGKTNGTLVTENDIKPYIMLNTNGDFPKCPLGGTYNIGRVGEDPKCSIGASAWPNDHTLNGTNYFWKNIKSAYLVLLGQKLQP
jgi:hypothetical protein